ncbi:hypothetical protein CL621_00035 [archaeon]|jgi:acyl-coenzyme A synthetase/AMP-(fatty) acid ligase|nr:hypothetical protein [archaeon]|tara:strand:+ start:1499 stop:1942 length:444 start_codon:yes stop_codon:yes gene_type:complete
MSNENHRLENINDIIEIVNSKDRSSGRATQRLLDAKGIKSPEQKLVKVRDGLWSTEKTSKKIKPLAEKQEIEIAPRIERRGRSGNGVRYDANNDSYQVRVCINKKRISFGYYKSKQEAIELRKEIYDNIEKYGEDYYKDYKKVLNVL